MFKSMTAYVYKTFALSQGTLSIEIQSVNRKHLDVTTYLPRELVRLESAVKKSVSKQNSRGNIVVRMSLTLEELSPIHVVPNLPLARQLRDAWSAIADDIGLQGDDHLKLALLKDEPGILNYENTLIDDEPFCDEILASLDQALVEFVAMKQQEGRALQADVEGRVESLKEWIEEIDLKADGATERYRTRLVERLEEVLPGCVENEERILREVCLYAEKVDISEEVTRFRSHISQFETLMSPEQEASGKKMEFLLQELLREANTIASKSSDIEVSHTVVDIKAELEKIREQLQNVE